MNIAIIGTGHVGKTLGERWASMGHSITFGSRNPGHARLIKILDECGSNAKASHIREAAQGNKVIVLAVPWGAAQQAVRAMGDLKGKVIIDCINPLKADLSGLAVDSNSSAGEKIQEWAKDAEVVKAFNTVGSFVMANPQYGDDKAALFICGNDASAKKTVKELASELGFNVLDAGGISASRYLEQLAMFWIHMAQKKHLGSDFAFTLLQR